MNTSAKQPVPTTPGRCNLISPATRLPGLAVVAAISLAAIPWQAGATTTNFQQGVAPTGAYAQDGTYIRSGSPDSNNDGDPDLEIIVGPTVGEVIRGLLEFDLSAIPATDQIDSASLVLTTRSTGAGIGGTETFNVYAYALDIDETTATWNAPDVGASDVAGGTLGTLLSSASFDVTQTGLTVTFADSPEFRTAVDNALAGDGFLRLIVVNTDEAVDGTHNFARFAADSFGTTGDRPELIVDHSIGAADVTPPTLSSTTPADDATGVLVSANLEATFSEPIALTGSGSITLKNQSGGADIPVTLPGDVSILGKVLTINPASNLVGDDEYAVEISSDAIEDLAVSPNPYAGILALDVPNWSFTADGTAPTSSGMGPAADASEVSPFSDLTLSFAEDVLAVAGKNIKIFLANGTPVETIAANDPAVTIVGTEVMIDLSDLTPGTAYYVNIDNGAFTDLSGNAYAGINDDTTWAFTTGSIPTGTIFLETFSGSGDLDTTEPDVTTWGATWTAATWQKDGTIADEEESSDTAWLPFVPLSGRVYTLTATLDAVASGVLSSSWTAFGFGNGSDTSVFWESPNDAAPWALYRATGTPDEIVSFGGPGVGGDNATHGTLSGPVTLSIVLDTTGSQWTAEWLEGSNSLRAYTFTSNPTISTVGFGRNADSDGPISSFSLSVGSGAEPLVLKITQSGGNLDFDWNSLPGMQYDLLSSDDPATETDPSLWAPYFDGVTTHEDIPATGTATMLSGVPRVGSQRFFALREEEIPPLFSEDFDDEPAAIPAGWVSNGPSNATDWEVATPSGVASGPTAANSTPYCAGTNIGGYYTENVNVTLTSPSFLVPVGSGATLSFKQFIDTDMLDAIDDDVGSVRILDADNADAPIPGLEITGIEGDGTAGWTNGTTLDMTAGEVGGKNIKIEFRFVSNAGTATDSDVWSGFYIDDVVVTEN